MHAQTHTQALEQQTRAKGGEERREGERWPTMKKTPKKQERKIIVFIEGLATLHASSLIDFQSKVSN